MKQTKKTLLISLTRFTTIILLVSVLLSLVGCNDAQEKSPANSSLTIYLDKTQENYLSSAIGIYKHTYPDVVVNVVIVDDDAGHTKTRAEIMAKKGPDIILVDDRTFPDAKKTLTSGFFANLTPFLEADSTYNPDDYYTEILNGGKHMDMQCVFPICFTFPAIITTQEALNQYDLSISDKPDFLEISEQSVKFIKQDNSMQLFPNQLDSNRFNYFNVIGDVVDFETSKIDLKNEKFLQATRNYKEFYKTGNTKFKNRTGPYGKSWLAASSMNEMFLLINTNYWYDEQMSNFLMLTELNATQTPRFVPIYGLNRTMNATMVYGLAINNYSANKQNAYDFLKTVRDLPFDESSYSSRISGYSVKKGEWKEVINHINERIVNDSIEYLPNEIHPAKKLDEQFIQQHEKTIEDIGYCCMPGGINDMLYQAFLPYFNDEASLESCIEAAQSTLEIYISE